MKWLIVVVVCLVVHASSELTDKIESDGLPALKVNFVEDENNKLNSQSDESLVETAGKSLTEASEHSEKAVPLISGLTQLEDESNDNELKRVKKSSTLTTICVEIKPTSPYEPPYFMCRGTEPQYHGSYDSKGGHKMPSHGGSGGPHKPSIPHGDGYGADGGYTPSNEYSYGKPGHSSGYGSQEEFSSGGHGMKPNVDKYGSSGHGGYGKPSSAGGYQRPSGHNSFSSYSGGAEFPKPAKYQITHDSYGPAVPSAHVKPIKIVIPSSDVEIYDTQSQSYGRPGNSYAPAFNSYGAVPHIKFNKQYGGGASHGPSFPVDAMFYGSGGVYSPDAAYNPSYKTKVLPLVYKKTTIGKYPQKHYGGGKKGQGYSSGGYRTTEAEDDDEEFEIQNTVGPQLQSPYHPGMSLRYEMSPPPQYMPRPAPMPPQTYTYPSPAPQVPCGSNLLFGCHPNVASVPCYGKGSAGQTPASVVYNVPSAPPSPVMYGPPMPQPPMAYYPHLGTPHQMTPPGIDTPGPIRTSGPIGMEQPKEMTDNQNFQQRSQSETDSDTERRIPNGVNTNDQDKATDDKLRQAPEIKPKNPSSPSADSFSTKPHITHAEMVRNVETGHEMNADNKMPTMNNKMETNRQNTPGQDIDMIKKNDEEETKKKIEAMMRMQQMQKMAQMMSGTPEGTHMRQDTMGGMNGVQSW